MRAIPAALVIAQDTRLVTSAWLLPAQAGADEYEPEPVQGERGAHFLFWPIQVSQTGAPEDYP